MSKKGKCFDNLLWFSIQVKLYIKLQLTSKSIVILVFLIGLSRVLMVLLTTYVVTRFFVFLPYFATLPIIRPSIIVVKAALNLYKN